MSKTLEVPDTKERLMEAAEGFMLGKGFIATSVDEICAEAKVTKGSFFYYFKNKDQLGQELVKRYSRKMGEKIMAKVQAAGKDPRDRILAFIDATVEISQCCGGKGCLIGTFAQELSESHPEIRGCCNDSFELMRQFFERELNQAKSKYAMDPDLDIKGLAESFIAISQGSMLLSKATQDRTIMTRTLTHYRQYLESLIPKK